MYNLCCLGQGEGEVNAYNNRSLEGLSAFCCLDQGHRRVSHWDREYKAVLMPMITGQRNSFTKEQNKVIVSQKKEGV